MDPREAERFEEGLDLEYHDASENPPVQEPSEGVHAHWQDVGTLCGFW